MVHCRSKQIHAFLPTPVEIQEFIAARTRIATQGEVNATAALPQHLACGTANPLWLNARKHRITGSVVGAILGMNKYNSPDQCLEDLINPSFTGNCCTEWGTKHEDDAQAATLDYLRLQDPTVAIDNKGLVLSTRKDLGWCGQSPDGVIADRNWLVEYKAPYGQRNLTMIPNVSVDLYPRHIIANAPSLGGHAVAIPPYYFAQVQWGAALSLHERILFVVWAPAGMGHELPFTGAASGIKIKGTCAATSIISQQTTQVPGGEVHEALVSTPSGLIQVTDIPRDDMWFKWAIPLVRDFWETRYVPRALHFANMRDALRRAFSAWCASHVLVRKKHVCVAI
jgi:hypothetical protein